MLKAQHLKVTAFVSAHPIFSPLIFIGIYIISVLLILPDSTILSLLGGFLFPMPLSILYICLAETLGALLFFLAVRYAFADAVRKIKNRTLAKISKKLQEHDVSYLLFLRLSHVFPFWLINIFAACFQIRTWQFVWTTFVGVLPLAIVFTQGGAGLSKFLKTDEVFTIHALFNTEIKLTLLGLAIVALIPVILEKYRKK